MSIQSPSNKTGAQDPIIADRMLFPAREAALAVFRDPMEIRLHSFEILLVHKFAGSLRFRFLGILRATATIP